MELDGLKLALGLLVLIAGPAGAAWTAVKVGLNGVRADVKDMKRDVREIRNTVMENVKDIAAIKGPE